MIFINFANENIADMKTRKVLSLIAFAFMTVALGACSDDNDYYYSPLIGDWVLVADKYGPVDGDQPIFQFYTDGSGTYTDYDWGNEYTYAIYWEPDGDLLYINFSDGQQWVYQWDIDGTFLYLRDLDTGSLLTFQMY
ncbi:hypothetical protein EEL49_08610 [Muribaculaceae bacterium Isolate-104 (HZI)]|nr:hypothetical protein EEL49_08610 [Muribaculaceae bacterium Isolate-104 (HZI)]